MTMRRRLAGASLAFAVFAAAFLPNPAAADDLPDYSIQEDTTTYFLYLVGTGPLAEHENEMGPTAFIWSRQGTESEIWEDLYDITFFNADEVGTFLTNVQFTPLEDDPDVLHWSGTRGEDSVSGELRVGIRDTPGMMQVVFSGDFELAFEMPQSALEPLGMALDTHAAEPGTTALTRCECFGNGSATCSNDDCDNAVVCSGENAHCRWAAGSVVAN